MINIVGTNNCISRNLVSDITKYKILKGDKELKNPIDIDTKNFKEQINSSILFLKTISSEYTNENISKTIKEDNENLKTNKSIQLNTYKIQCEGIVWDTKNNIYNEDDEEDNYNDNLDLPEEVNIYIDASSAEEAEDKIADKLSDEYGYCVNHIRDYTIQKINSLAENNDNKKNKCYNQDNKQPIYYSEFLSWLYTIPKEWNNFLKYFREDEDISIDEVSVDPEDAKDYIKGRESAYNLFLSKFGDREIIYDE